MFSFAQEPTLYTTTLEVETVNGAAAGAAVAGVMFWMFMSIVLWVLMIVALWKVFTKAGEPGWKCIIPIYNVYTLLKIVGRPGWWLLLFLVPFVNLVVALVVSIDVAKSFGKSELFGVVGLFFFSFIGYLMLGFGDAKYNGPSVQQVASTPQE
jgi:hypothetical protein